MFERYLELTDRQRDRFDALLERHIDTLPPGVRERLDEMPLIVDDEPEDALLDELGMAGGELCGLHWGVPMTERGVEHSGALPDQMRLFRGPIMRTAEGHAYQQAGRRRPSPDEMLEELDRQVRITLLHEIGHHFGLDEDQLTELGYG